MWFRYLGLDADPSGDWVSALHDVLAIVARFPNIMDEGLSSSFAFPRRRACTVTAVFRAEQDAVKARLLDGGADEWSLTAARGESSCSRRQAKTITDVQQRLATTEVELAVSQTQNKHHGTI